MSNYSASKSIAVIVAWIRLKCEHAAGLLVPISGGSDSALTFWLCAQASPDKTLAVFVGEPDELRGRDWFESVGQVRYVRIADGPDNPEALRWARFISICLQKRYWLFGTRNRTETVLGTYSMASTVARQLPLDGLWKTEVMELCRQVGVPKEILQSSRRADPECGRPPEMASIPLETVDLFLQVKIGELPESHQVEIDPAIVQYLDSLYCLNRFKADLPACGPRPEA